MVRSRRRRRSSERGFTLIEIMFVVVIIAVLAVIAIPQFTETSNKSKAKSEVVAFFAELGKREEQFKVDNSVYFPIAPGTTTACPAGTLDGQTRSTTGCIGTGNPWNTLNVTLPTTTAYCNYAITSGNTAVTNPTVGGVVWTFSGAVNTSWYYILATCDLDGDGTFARFFTSSNSSDLQVNNEGE